MSYIKVEGHDGLVRDQNTGAIINRDDSAMAARRKSQPCKLGSALDDINMLKNEISEIKSLLRELVKMPAINVARTDTFEQQRVKINEIATSIFNVTQGGSDLSTGNLKLGDGTRLAPSLAFTSDSELVFTDLLSIQLGLLLIQKDCLIFLISDLRLIKILLFKRIILRLLDF